MMGKRGIASGIFAIVDTETTGMRNGHDRIIDVAVIRIENGAVVETFSTLVNPGFSISERTTQITGITQEALARAPSFDEIALTLERLFDQATLVAHNAAFDYGFLKSEFARLSMRFSIPTLCTVKISRALFPNFRTHDLDALITRHGFSCPVRHRALPDAQVLVQFLNHINETVAHTKLEAVLDRLLLSAVSAKVQSLKELPTETGIYYFYGPQQELLYVGKSKNIRTRVRSHFSDASKKEQMLRAQTVRVATESTAGELSALLLEAQTIKAEQPLYNRALRRRKEIVVGTREITETGFATVALRKTEVFDPTKSVVLVARSMARAKEVLRSIAKEHGLCLKLLGLELGTVCFAYHLGTCAGACAHKESIAHYNDRFDAAFEKRKVRVWPYAGPIIIEEKNAQQEQSTVFFIDNWCLIASFVCEDGSFREFITPDKTFCYDTYKILARFILEKKNRCYITSVSPSMFERTIATCRGEYEMVIE